jgi:Fic-DOC domain mobile mystery protein B
MGLVFQYTNGQTPLDEEEKTGLKIKSISTQGELDEFEQSNIEEAIRWTIETKFKLHQILTEQFIQKVHRNMFGDVWNWAGEFRKTDKNIGVKWNLVSVELKILLDDVRFWIEHDTYSKTEIAIRFKHRLVSIHCFPNGNGRHSRLMADIVHASIFQLEVFSWSRNSILKPSEARSSYILALRKADRGNIQPLIDFAVS